MKVILFICLLLLSQASFAQWPSTCYDTSGVHGGWGLDTNDFDAIQTPHFRIAIDTTDTTNLWAIGSVTKPGFLAAIDGLNAIQTDTANPYAINSTSQFCIWRDTNMAL